MIKVLLVIPPLPERSYPGKFMGVDYLASALQEKKHKVKILDLDVLYLRNTDILKYYKTILNDYEPDLVGITNMSIQNDIANLLAWFTKNEKPETIVIKGGFHETMGDGWKYTLELHHSYVDACVSGEGEFVIQQVAGSIDKGTWDERISDIPNLAYWDGHKAVKNGSTQWEEVDPNIFIPSRLNYYPEFNFDVFNFRKTAQMMTVRGCPYDCAFCSEAFFPEIPHYRKIGHIRKEFDILEKEGYEAIYFDDPTFTLKQAHIQELVKELNKRDFIWGCNTRVDRISEGDVEKLAESGCVYIFCGVESLVPETLLAMNKTLKPDKYLENVPNVYKWMRKVGISPSVFLIFGNARKESDGTINPETWDDVEYTVRKSIEMDTDYLSLNILRLLPGVPYSFYPNYNKIRPTGSDPVHGGHYDMKWYLENGVDDLRSKHPIFRCFEGSRSVNAEFVSPEYAYKIIKLAIDQVNEHNMNSGRQVRIVVDYKATNAFFFERKIVGRIQYDILPFNEIPPEVDSIDYLDYWNKILLDSVKV